MYKIITIILIPLVLVVACGIVPKSSFIGYQENCLSFQSAKVDSVLKTSISSERYLELFNLNKSDALYKILFVLEIDSNGNVKNVIIKDRQDYLTISEKKILNSKLFDTFFDICLSEPEQKHLSKEVVFKDKKTIQYGLVVPYTP